MTVNGNSSLIFAYQNCISSVIDILVTNGADVDVECKGVTLLGGAVLDRDFAKVSQLLSFGAEVNKKCGLNGYTSLHIASGLGYVEIAKILIEYGADVDIQVDPGTAPDYRDRNCTSLHLASAHGHVEIVKLLLYNKVNVNIENFDGWTPLDAAAIHEHFELAKILLAHGGTIGSHFLNSIPSKTRVNT
jgi:ankyrin repeat protein